MTDDLNILAVHQAVNWLNINQEAVSRLPEFKWLETWHTVMFGYDPDLEQWGYCVWMDELKRTAWAVRTGPQLLELYRKAKG